MRQQPFDPDDYIESAFLDHEGGAAPTETVETTEVPTFGEFVKRQRTRVPRQRSRFRQTQASAPRPRRVAAEPPPSPLTDDLKAAWEALPASVDFLIRYFDDDVTSNYYRGEFKESRQELIRRLLDPELSLEETSRLLGVCPATVRRYTNRGWLSHHRTAGGQRRFRLSAVVRFVNERGRLPKE